MVARRWGMTVVALRLPFTDSTERIDWFSDVSTKDPTMGVNDGWAYLHSRDAAHAMLLSLTAGLDGVHVFYVAARDTTVPYATSELLDRYAPDVPRRRAFSGREPAVDVEDARRLLGFEAEYALDLDLLPLPKELATR